MKRTSRIWNIIVVICLAIVIVTIIVKCLAQESPVKADDTEVTTSTEEVSYTICTSEPAVSATEESTTVEETVTEEVTTEPVPERYEWAIDTYEWPFRLCTNI